MVVPALKNSLWGFLGLLFSTMFFLVSCNKDPRPPLVQVKGKVLVGQKPAHMALVRFFSVEPLKPGSPLPRGIVDQDGNFAIGTYATGDGVPPGKYRISIAWNAPGDFGDEEGESLLPLRYLDPATSGLPEVEVLKDSVTLPPFHLTLN